MIFSKPTKMTDALNHATARRVLPLAFSAREIEKHLPAQILARAAFSARTMYAGYLAESQAFIGRMVQSSAIRQADGSLRPSGKGESLSPVKVRALMRRHLARLGYQAKPGEEGTITDLSSDRRISLIINTQSSMSRQYGRWRARQAPAILTAFPADRLYRAQTRNKKRNWQSRWNDARRSLGGATKATAAASQQGPFIAPKNDPIWSAISRFGNPYPPFDYRSGMRVRSVPASQAATHGITSTPAPAQEPFTKELKTSLRPGMPQAMLKTLLKAFPGATVENGKLAWSPNV